MPTVARRWRRTTLNDQFGTFGDTVDEYSFELEPDVVLTCGALVLHPDRPGPKTGGKWGHLYLFANETTRQQTLTRDVHRRHYANVRLFLLRDPLKSNTLAHNVRHLCVLSDTPPVATFGKDKTRRREARRARTSSRKKLWTKSAGHLKRARSKSSTVRNVS